MIEMTRITATGGKGRYTGSHVDVEVHDQDGDIAVRIQNDYQDGGCVLLSGEEAIEVGLALIAAGKEAMAE